MKYDVETTSGFRHDYKVVQKRGYDMQLLEDIVKMLANGVKLPPRNKDHELIGNWKGYRECHITPDWLLLYRYDNNRVVLVLTSTGTHSDIYKK